jgi:hypothetical protein
MGTTLYVLRQPLDHISTSIFRTSDSDMDIVFVEQAASVAPSFMKGFVVAAEGMAVGRSRPTITYDDLIEKIFSTEHIVVV